GCGEGLVQLLADGRRGRRDLLDLGDVVLVARVLAVGGAAAYQDDEQDDAEDHERNQPRQAQHGDEPRGRPDRAARAAWRLPARRSYAFGSFFGLRLVEEVELAVCIPPGHGFVGPAEAD